MAEAYLMKTHGGSLVPVDEESTELVQKNKVGQGFRCKLVKVRNIGFHRKFFALLNYAFEQWNPTEKTYKGIPVSKNFKQFREDITILAGFYEANVRINGDIRFTATSIAFDKMDQDEFEKLYSEVIDVLLKRIFINQTRDDVDRVVNNILSFC